MKDPQPLPRSAALLAALVFTSCDRSPAPSETKPAAPAAASDTAGFAPSRATLSGAPVAKYLPADTVVLASTTGLSALLETLGRRRIVAGQHELYELAVQHVRAATGHNLTNPANFRAIGLDGEGETGFFVLDVPTRTGGAYVSVADAGALRAFLAARASAMALRIIAEKVGDAEILYPEGGGERGSLVLRGPLAILVVSGSPDGDAAAVARQVANQDEKTSLANVADFGAVLGRLAFGKSLSAYVEMGPLVKLAIGEAKAPSAQGALAKDVWGSFSRVAMGIELSGSAMRSKLVLPLADAPYVTGVLRNGHGVPVLLRATSQAPLGLLNVNVDPKAFVTFVERVLAADGGEARPGAVGAALEEVTGLDLEADLLPALSGEVGAAVVGDLAALYADERDAMGALGGHLVVGFKGAEKGAALVGKVAGRGLMGAKLEPAGGEHRWTVATPWKTLHVAMAGRYLTVSTDAGFADRVAAGDGAASFTRKLAHEPLVALLSKDGPALLYTLHHGLTGALLMPRGARAPRPPIPAGPAGDADYESKAAALTALYGKVDALRAETDAARKKMVRETFGALGVFAASVTLEKDAAVVYGGQFYGAEDTASVVTRIVAAASELAKRKRDTTAARLGERRVELEQALEALRSGAE